jgi:hypothetical protein
MMGAQDAQRSTKKQLLAFCLTFLIPYHREGDGMLSNIVIVDETWCPISQLNQNSSPCTRNILAGRKGKVQAEVFKWKIVRTVFWEKHGVVLVEVLHQGTTINSAVYCETLKNLRREIPNKILKC